MLLDQSYDVIDLVDPALLAAPLTSTDAGQPALLWNCDPLDPDAAADVPVTTSSRRLLRLAIAAADAGSRFTREGLELDPVAWMLTPRSVFEGLPAMEACQELKHFERSIALHALGLGLDADPRAIDEILSDEGEDDEDDHDGTEDACVVDVGMVVGTSTGEADEMRLPRPLLLTSWLDVVRGDERLFAFCAIVTDRPVELVDRLVGRYGRDATRAEFAVGFDHTTPRATAMISDAMADTLALAAADPESPLAAGLDVVVEQRFVEWTRAA